LAILVLAVFQPAALMKRKLNVGNTDMEEGTEDGNTYRKLTDRILHDDYVIKLYRVLYLI
jgi:hypothetical protein